MYTNAPRTLPPTTFLLWPSNTRCPKLNRQPQLRREKEPREYSSHPV